jgi:hypothetical protein
MVPLLDMWLVLEIGYDLVANLMPPFLITLGTTLGSYALIWVIDNI